MGKKIKQDELSDWLCHIDLKNKGILLSSKPVSATTRFLQEKMEGDSWFGIGK
jgi:hypothetical protein